jgi:betaine reductase
LRIVREHSEERALQKSPISTESIPKVASDKEKPKFRTYSTEEIIGELEDYQVDMLRGNWCLKKRNFEKAVSYPPNQVFIGNLDPDDLLRIPSPWYKNPTNNSSRWGPFGEIMPEEEFYGMMKICDEFQLFQMEEGFLKNTISKLKTHPLFSPDDLKKLDKGVSLNQIEKTLSEGFAMPVYVQGDQLVGCLQRGHEEDISLIPEILIENLTARASGVLALRHLIAKTGEAQEIEYLLGCGEEAVGDRYNRGGGSLSKAIGELCGCAKATGSDVKAFCCAPVHAMVLAASLVSSKIFRDVVVVGGGLC